MQYDYVIVGGGSAGSVLASRLSEDPKVTVCLLEAGGGGNGILVRLPLGVFAMGPGKPFKINNWAFQTTPQPGLNGRRGFQPRGKALGGSSAINAMLYIRGQREDYDTWAKDGCPGWDWDSVLPYFRRAENNERGADAFHGADGPLQVSDQKEMRPMSRAFVEAAQQLQHRPCEDFNDGDNEGSGFFQVTQFHDARNGERCSAAAGYLFPVMGRPNLTVITRAECTGLTFEGTRATGVTYRHKGAEHTARAGREVLLSAGAFKTPQILQLSGIGDPEDLKPHGIAVRHALPGVGKNLQDHLDFTLSFRTRDTDCPGLSPGGALKMAWHLWRWRRTGVSMAATCFAEAAVFAKTDPAMARPDIGLHFTIVIVDDHARNLHYGYGFSCHMCKLRPESRGTVRIASADPRAAPAIDPGFLSDPRDVDTMIKGARMTREIMMAEPLAKYRQRELFGTEHARSDADWENHIRARADTTYHPVGTCRMGSDGDAVVDPQLRLNGIAGLRVVDASIMPRLVSGNTNAPTIMIAEKAADMIRSAARC